jgi:hypothetical protein
MRLPNLWIMLLTFGFVADARAAAPEAKGGMPYAVKGQYYETCACHVSCPCADKLKPSEMQCDAIMVFHIDKGSVGKVALDSLNLAGVIRAPKNAVVAEAFEKGEMDLITFYFDDKATPEQREAIGKVMPALFGDKEFKGMKAPQFVPMKLDIQGDNAKFEASGGKINFDIDNLTIGDDTKLGAKTKPGKKRVTLTNTAPFPWVSEVTQGKAKTFHYEDHGFKWSYDGRNAFFASFASKGKTK